MFTYDISLHQLLSTKRPIKQSHFYIAVIIYDLCIEQSVPIEYSLQTVCWHRHLKSSPYVCLDCKHRVLYFTRQHSMMSVYQVATSNVDHLMAPVASLRL